MQNSVTALMVMRRQGRQRIVLAAVSVAVLYLMWKYVRPDSVDWELMDGDIEGGGPAVRSSGIQHDKWIICTTVQSPTADLHKIVKIPGWQLLVVGDRNTPQNWKLEGAIFLDVRRQRALGYRTTKLIPYDSYSRKNIGYLYAIEHGAQYIYDTDDDNVPSDLDIFDFTTDFDGQFLVVDTDNLTYNPFPHFGQPSLWPRGYPLDRLGMGTHHRYKLCSTGRPVIQQGMVNGDPDLDAIFRLTRVPHNQKIKLMCDSSAPSVMLPGGTFASMNSQNTIFTAKALWALILPVSFGMRAVDIQRAYWAQRLTWLSGDRVAFYPPTAYQVRNKHSYKKDFQDEDNLYKDMGNLVQFLNKWTCSQVFFFDCMTQLSRALVQAGLWGQVDGDLMEAWVTDLANLGYVPPALQQGPTCHSKDPVPVIFHPTEQDTILPTGQLQAPPAAYQQLAENFLDTTCPKRQVTKSETHFSNLLLVLDIPDTTHIPMLEALYRKSFSDILYCGHQLMSAPVRDVVNKWKVSYISPSQNTGVVSCLHAAMSMKYHVTGYLYVPHNALLLAEQLIPLHSKQMWMTGDLHIYKPDMVTLCEQDILHCQAVSKQKWIELNHHINTAPVSDRTKTDLQHCFKKLAADPTKQDEVIHLTDLVVHIPSRSQAVFQQLAKVYLKPDLLKYSFVSILLMECLEVAPDYLKFANLASANQPSDQHYIYPFSYQLISDKGQVENAKYCDVATSSPAS